LPLKDELTEKELEEVFHKFYSKEQSTREETLEMLSGMARRRQEEKYREEDVVTPPIMSLSCLRDHLFAHAEHRKTEKRPEVEPDLVLSIPASLLSPDLVNVCKLYIDSHKSVYSHKDCYHDGSDGRPAVLPLGGMMIVSQDGASDSGDFLPVLGELKLVGTVGTV
jgi:hypothetical protein